MSLRVALASNRLPAVIALELMRVFTGRLSVPLGFHFIECRPGDCGPEQTGRDPGGEATTRATRVREIGRTGVFLGTCAARTGSTQRCFARGCIRNLSWAVANRIEIVICSHLLFLHFKF